MVHRMIAKSARANSSAGRWMNSTAATFSQQGSSWASVALDETRLLAVATITSFESMLIINSQGFVRAEMVSSEDSAVLFMHRFLIHSILRSLASGLLLYGIGLGPGVGATPHMACAQGGSGSGAGISEPLPCVEASPPDEHLPV